MIVLVNGSVDKMVMISVDKIMLICSVLAWTYLLFVLMLAGSKNTNCSLLLS